MSRRSSLIFGCLLAVLPALADDQAIWHEYGLVSTQTVQQGPRTIVSYRMKDLTGALAAWQWQRASDGRPCDLAPVCSATPKRTLIADDNYLLEFEGPVPSKPQLESELKSLPNKRETSLPAILTFLPRQGLLPNSSRYILGPESFKAFAPELSQAQPGFNEGVEAQLGQFNVANFSTPARLALFYYATPEMARLHSVDFKTLPGVHVKRSGLLIAVVFGATSEAQADTLLSRVEYEARITWNDVPGPNPIRPLYRLLRNIIYLSVLLSALAFMAGLIYGGMRLYRRRYGTLEADEAMTTLHLTGD